MEGIARIGRYTIDLTEQMGRMMVFLLSSFAWLTRPPFRFYQIVKQLNFLRTSLSAFPLRWAMSAPSIQISPRSGCMRPIMCFSSTLFPDPLPPMMVVSFPSGIVRSTPRKTGCPPKVFSTPTSLIMPSP